MGVTLQMWSTSITFWQMWRTDVRVLVWRTGVTVDKMWHSTYVISWQMWHTCTYVTLWCDVRTSHLAKSVLPINVRPVWRKSIWSDKKFIWSDNIFANFIIGLYRTLWKIQTKQNFRSSVDPMLIGKTARCQIRIPTSHFKCDHGDTCLSLSPTGLEFQLNTI